MIVKCHPPLWALVTSSDKVIKCDAALSLAQWETGPSSWVQISWEQHPPLHRNPEHHVMLIQEQLRMRCFTLSPRGVAVLRTAVTGTAHQHTAETVRQQHFFGTVWFLLDVNNWIERLNSYFGRLNSLLKLEGGGGPPICTQQDGVYVTHTGCDDIMMKKMMMMEKGEIDQNHTGPQVVLVKRIIMKHDSPVRITYNRTININIRLSVTLHTCARTEQ